MPNLDLGKAFDVVLKKLNIDFDVRINQQLMVKYMTLVTTQNRPPGSRPNPKSGEIVI